MRIAVLGSTKGTSLQGLIDGIESGKVKDVEISFVLSNKKDAIILERARKHNIKDIYLDPGNKSDKEYDSEISKFLKEYKIELVLLIGYMKIMSKEFVNDWKNKVMNIHPSLLPNFAGKINKSVHKAVLDSGCKVSGATLIFIDEGEDTGPIILQSEVEIDEGETVDSLKDKVQAVECDLIIKGVELFRDGKINVKEGKVELV